MTLPQAILIQTLHHKSRSDQVDVRQTATMTAHLCASPELGGSTLLLSVIGGVAVSMEDTTAIVTTDHCAPVTKAGQQQAPGDEEDEGDRGWDIRKESWNPQSAVKLPVLTQPGLGVTTTTVTTITQTGGDWSSSLYNLCGDRTTCLLGAFVPCCLDLSLAHQYGECLCLPLLPGSTFAMRVGIRERYKIRGSVCEDWTTVYCCYPLAICQMIREMKRRMKSQTYQVSTALECS